MSYLVRFEDKYGMYDLFCMLNGIDMSNSKVRTDKTIYNEHKNLYIESSLSNTNCFKVLAETALLLSTKNITDIIVVVDLDASNNDGTTTLMPKHAVDNCRRFRDSVNKINSNIRIHYVPTVFASETLMLYQFFRKGISEHFVIEDIVHPINTWNFHLLMVAILIECNKLKQAKCVRDYCNTGIIRKAFKNALATGDTRNMILINFMLRKSNGVSEQEFINIIAMEYNGFANRKKNVVQFNLAGVPIDSHTSLFRIRSKFEHFPKGYR